MLALDGTHTATATVTLTTTARGMVSLPDLPRSSPLRLPRYAWALPLAYVAVLAALLGFCGRKWVSELRLRLAKTAAVVALSLCAYWVAASTPATITGSYGGVTKTAMLTVMPVSSGGTPAGTYSLTLTGTSGNLSHSTTVQVIVN
jgi:hypothetical protein